MADFRPILLVLISFIFFPLAYTVFLVLFSFLTSNISLLFLSFLALAVADNTLLLSASLQRRTFSLWFFNFPRIISQFSLLFFGLPSPLCLTESQPIIFEYFALCSCHFLFVLQVRSNYYVLWNKPSNIILQWSWWRRWQRNRAGDSKGHHTSGFKFWFRIQFLQQRHGLRIFSGRRAFRRWNDPSSSRTQTPTFAKSFSSSSSMSSSKFQQEFKERSHGYQGFRFRVAGKASVQIFLGIQEKQQSELWHKKEPNLSIAPPVQKQFDRIICAISEARSVV